MGSFANAIFSALLGWLEGAVAGLWGLVSGQETAWLSYLADNWLPLLVLLCAGCLLADLVVYLLRWQPYRVWASFLYRMKHRDELDEDDTAVRREWVFADGTTAPEEAITPPPAPRRRRRSREDEHIDAPVRPVKRVVPAKHRRGSGGTDEYLIPQPQNKADTYHQPYYPPQWRDTNPGGNE
ncbi:MAG: hypothetical protein IJ438_05330 [Clostridia bacterium]|nr:hypothetical protein [Clostridia bacterium]